MNTMELDPVEKTIAKLGKQHWDKYLLVKTKKINEILEINIANLSSTCSKLNVEIARLRNENSALKNEISELKK